MRFSYAESMIDPTMYAPLAQAAEAAGFDSFVVPDSICYPTESDTTYPYNSDGTREFLEGKPFIEPFSLIPWMAAVTERIRFTTFVVKLPVRHPVLVAKQLSSIGALAPGRMAFGVGTSPWPEDYTVTGSAWAKRGARMDEMIEIINALQEGAPYAHDGRFYSFPEITLCPAATPRVPIMIGGHSAMALERAGRLGDGWMHGGGEPGELARMMDVINESRRRHGRADEPFEVHAISIDAYSVDGVERLAADGVTDAIVGFRDAYQPGPDPQSLDEKIAAVQWYGEEIISAVRS